jgi:hypothetical protein
MMLGYWVPIFLAIGIAAIGVGVCVLIPSVRVAVRASRSAEGTVVGHAQEDGETTYFYPLVSFAVGGVDCVVKGPTGHMRPTPSIGSRVHVYFPSNDPKAAIFSRFGGVWVGAILIAFGILFSVVPVWEWLVD